MIINVNIVRTTCPHISEDNSHEQIGHHCPVVASSKHAFLCCDSVSKFVNSHPLVMVPVGIAMKTTAMRSLVIIVLL